MATIAENLERIQNAKTAIKNAIIAKGVEVDDETIDKYADKIAQISGGGSASADFISVMKGKMNMSDALFASLKMAEIDVSGVTDMSFLFEGCDKLTSIDLSAWNVESCTTMLDIFYGCGQLTNCIGDYTQTDVDNGQGVFLNNSCAIDLSETALDVKSICAIIRGLATITSQSAMINLSHTQYANVQAYTTVDYIALAKSKGWLVGNGGYSDETLDCEQAGTIIGKDADGNIKYVKYADFIADDFDTTTFTPIAVLAIPKSHTADGKCRGVSLMQMSIKTPEAGTTSNETFCWGVYGTDESLTNYNSLTTGNVELGGTLGVASNGYLPTDSIVGTASVVDVDGGIAKSQYGNSTPYIPSPYGASGIVNTQYHDGSSANKVQANTDMKGEENMETITQVVADSSASGVLIADSGAIANSQANYPAFSTCYRYQGGGYKDNSWYLPSCGELGYFVVRWGAINNALTAIRSKYGTSAACLVSSTTYHWCSTEYSSGSARYVMPSSGYVSSNNKYNYFAVRAFHVF